MEGKTSGKLLLKTNLAIKHKWEPFYTGGAVAVSDEGRTLLCSCGDTVQVIDVESGAIKTSLSQEGDDVTCVLCSPDNTIVVSATRSLLLKQWKIENETSECVRTWKAIHTSPILCMDFDATSTLLATGSSDSTIKIWDMLHQYCTHNLRGSQGVITVVKFHPCDLKLLSASNDYAIRIWDLNTSRCLSMLKGHVSAVTSLAFDVQSVDDLTLISGGRDSVICLWDIGKEKLKPSMEPFKTIPVFETIEKVMIFSKNNAEKILGSKANDVLYILTAGNSGVLKLWDTKRGECVYCQKKLDADSKSEHRAITELLHLKSLEKYATVTFDHNINFFTVDDKFNEDKHLVGYNDEVLDVKFIGFNDSHIVVATNSPLVKLFDLKSSACQLLEGHRDTVLTLDVFKNNLTFISGSKDNSVRVWRISKSDSIAKCVAVGRSHTHAVTTVACARIKCNFFASGSQDLTLKIWRILSTTDENGKPVTTLKVIHTIKAHEKDINSVAISPNDKLIATGSQDKTAKLWSVSEGVQLGSFSGHKRGIWSCVFSPTDQVLGTSSADGTIKLWSLSDFTCLKTFEGHDCSVLKMIFISRGTQIMTSGSNGLMKLWNIKSSECVKTFEGHDDKVWGLAVNSDDNLVLSGAADSKILQWEDVTEKERMDAQQEQETTILQHQELNNLMHEKKFAKAFKLAITLQQPFTALKVLKEMNWEQGGDDLIRNTISKLRDDQKDVLLKFLMSWNTNSRNCHEAQKVLSVILKETHSHELMKFPNAQAAIEALIPYTERHYQRMSRLMINTTFVDYVWQMMKLKPIALPDVGKPSTEDSNTSESTTQKQNPNYHPLKLGFVRPVSLPKTRTKKPDQDSGNDSESEEDKSVDDESVDNVTVEEVTNPTPPKKMRLRSAANNEVKDTVSRSTRKRKSVK